MEKLYIAEKVGGEYIVKGFVEREYAEKHGIRHMTTIIVPFIRDGDDKGKWIVSDRMPKQRLKNKNVYKDGVECNVSYNLVGGHCTAEDYKLFGLPIPPAVIEQCAEREICEEVKLDNSDYAHEKLIEIGFTEYSSDDNVEYSFVYAMPVYRDDYEKLMFFDDYIDKEDGKHKDIKLGKGIYTEEELKNMHYNYPNTEICDAITRLWQSNNSDVLGKLHEAIQNKGGRYYCVHIWQNDSKGTGTGIVTAWCKKCGKYSKYYDDTGTTISEGYDSSLIGVTPFDEDQYDWERANEFFLGRC